VKQFGVILRTTSFVVSESLEEACRGPLTGVRQGLESFFRVVIWTAYVSPRHCPDIPRRPETVGYIVDQAPTEACYLLASIRKRLGQYENVMLKKA